MNETNTIRPLALNQRMIDAANSANHHNAGSILAREAEQVYTDGLKAFEPRPDWTPEQHTYAARRADEWRALVEESYNDIIRRRASWMPWTVCGPARYDSRKNSAKADAQMRASMEWQEKRKRFMENTARQLADLRTDEAKIAAYRTGRDDSPISADDPLALDKLDARISFLEEQHTRNMMLNKHYRKHKTMKGAPGITDEQAAKLDAEMERLPECMRQIGFTANESANIRRLKERRAALEKARAAAQQETNAPETFDGLRIIRNAADNRVQIIFDEKPDENARCMLKKEGFRWSPRAGAWQRQLNDNGIRAAHRIAKQLAPQEPEQQPAQEPETLTPEEFAARFAK